MKIRIARFMALEDVQIPAQVPKRGLDVRRIGGETADHEMHVDTTTQLLTIRHLHRTVSPVHVPLTNIRFFEEFEPAPVAETWPELDESPGEAPTAAAVVKPSKPAAKAGKVTVSDDE